MIPGVVASQITGPSMATTWMQTSTTSTSPSVNYNTGDVNCRSAAQALTWLNANYPASGYTVGTIIRVRVITSTPALCATFYFEGM